MTYRCLWRSLLATFCLSPLPLLAQSPDWTRVDQGSAWYGAFVEEAISQRTSFWFDGQWRRMGLGQKPQQLLLRPGVLATVAPGVQVGTGYAWIATAPYGESPAANPSREHRIWQQLLLSHRAGALDLRHRYRLEQRWVAPVVNEETGTWTRQHRARYMMRAQGDLPGLQINGKRLMGFAWDELFLPLGDGGASARLAQNRIGAGVGIPLDARRRLEVGYMNLWNPLAARTTNEFNHTLTISLIAAPSRKAIVK